MASRITADVFLVDILHVTHDLSILGKPRAPRIPGLIEGAWQIVCLPDALVLLRQSFPRGKVALLHLAVECPGVLDEQVNGGLFPFPEHLRRMGAVRIWQAVSMEHGDTSLFG